MKVQHTATLDFTDNGVFETGWRIKQGDYGNTELVLRLVNNGVNVYDAEITPQIAFRRWDGASVISVMTPNDQTYKYAFAGNELEVPGLTLCDVKFTDAEGRVSTASCRFTVVEDTVGYDPTGAHTYDNPVSELVEQATNAAEVGIESSFKAEGFAVGEQGGVPVEEGSPYYHNNAKYYSNLAGDPIGTAVEEQTTTTGQFTTKTGGKLESCIVAFEPIQSGSGTPSPSNVRPITGHSSVKVGNVGKNKLPLVLSDIKELNTAGTWSGNIYTYDTVTFEVKTDNDGNVIDIVVNGASTGTRTFYLSKSILLTDNTSYTLTGCPTGGSNSSFRLSFYNGADVVSHKGEADGVTINYTKTSGNEVGAYIRVYNQYQLNNLSFKPMIRLATETDATFVPYNGYTKTIALGQTVYGGSLDVVSGVLTVTHAFNEFDGSSDENWTINGTGSGQYPFANIAVSGNNTTTSIVCNEFTATAIYTNNQNVGVYKSTTNLRVRPDFALTDATAWKTWLASHPLQVVYPLATPLVIQLTPQQINTLIGENHLDVPLTGQSLTSAVYREMFTWSDILDAINAAVSS